MSYIKNNFENSSQIESEGEINTEGKKTGKWIYYYPNGKVKSTGNFENNLAQGEWVYYAENGIIQSRGNFDKGLCHGPWEWFDEQGNLREKGSYQNNLLHGFHTWYKDGIVNIEGEYQKGEKTGEWRYYNTQANLIRRDNYFHNQLHGISEIFDDTGSLKEVCHYHFGFKHGEHITYKDGKKKVQIYEMGLPLLKETEFQKIAEKINTQKDYYKKTDVLIKKFGYEGITPALWHLITHNYLDINKHSDLFYELTAPNAEIFFTADKVIKILQKLHLVNIPSNYGLTPYWNIYLDKMTFYAYHQNPRAFDDSFDSFTEQAQKGFCMILARSGKTFPEKYKKEILHDIATQVTRFGSLGQAKTGQNKQEFIYYISTNEIVEVGILNSDGGFNEAFYKFIENFGSYAEWQRQLLTTCLNNHANIQPAKCQDAFLTANVEQFCNLLKRCSYFGYQKLHNLFISRNFSISELEKCAQLLDDGWQKGYKAEIALTVAILQCQDQNLPVPEWYDEWLSLSSFYWGETNGILFDGLDFTKKALEYLGKERAYRIILAKLESQYEWEKGFAFLTWIDKKDWDKFFIKLQSSHNQNLYYARSFIIFLSELDLAVLEEKVNQFSQNQVIYEIFIASIVVHLSNLAEKRNHWDEKFDEYIKLHIWKSQYQDDFEYYLLPYYKKVASFLPSERVEKIFLPQINLNESTFGRIFGIMNEKTPVSLLQKAAETLVQASTSQISKARRYVYNYILDYRESVSPYFVKLALQKGAKGEILEAFQEGLSKQKYEQILQELNMQTSAQSSKIAAIKSMCEKYLAQNPEVATTTIYYLEPLYDQKPTADSLNYIGKHAPIHKELIPTCHKKKMQHIFTLDIRTMPLLAKRVLQDTIAISFFVFEPEYNEAYEPFNNQTAILFLKENDIQQTKKETDSYTFQITELQVPNEIFDYECNEEAAEIRKKVFQAPCYVLGEPIWLQDEQHQGNFILQFDETFGGVNLGDGGVMYVFEDTAFWQCY
ncbi:MAG: toxin-antitoxin system YwqK family antitoxin [Raineya sp.]|nr:toxin-antitoxin system YwqK family antitoxin [Raineya sp.]MDW8296592.1 toxin-antitoxin system YwqK family antitoxin [Raineya sp.]